MCGRLNITDNPGVIELLDFLGIDLNYTPLHNQRFARAASKLQIVRESGGQRVLQDATWWLLLDEAEQGFKPSKYTSFNTRYDKLNTPRSAGYIPYRQSRCIVPAAGFGETVFEYKGSRKIPKHYYDFEAVDGAIAFGGLYKEYINKHTGEVATGCSVITLPSHPRLKALGITTTPLMLAQDNTMDAWLNADAQQVEQFDWLLQPTIRQDLKVTPIDKPASHQAVADAFIVKKD